MSKLEVDKIDPQSGTDLELGTSGDTITIPAGVTFDSSAATNTLPSTVVTTTGTQTLTNKSIDASQLTGTVATSNLGSGTASSSTFLRGDQTYAAAGGTNTPAFEAYASATQTGIGDNTATKMAMNTELFDTNSMYDTSAYRFTPTVAGKYFVYGLLYLESSSGTRADRAVVAIYKNGSSYKQVVAMNVVDNISSGPSGNVSAVIEFNGSSDYVELYGQLNVYTGTVELDGRTAGGNFGAYKIIE